MSMLHFHADATCLCQCCMSIAMLRVHCPYWCGCHVSAACYISMLHFRAVCSFCIPMMYVHAASTCCILMLLLHAAYHADWPCSMSLLHTLTTSTFLVIKACPLCKAILQANAVCNASCPWSMPVSPYWMYMLLFHAACPTVCPCCINMLHFHAIYPCSMSIQHVYAACQCFMAISPHCLFMLHTSCKSILHEQNEQVAWTWTWTLKWT